MSCGSTSGMAGADGRGIIQLRFDEPLADRVEGDVRYGRHGELMPLFPIGKITQSSDAVRLRYSRSGHSLDIHQ